MTLRQYAPYLRLSVKRALVYRLHLWVRLGTNVMNLVLWTSLWAGLYQSKYSPSGTPFQETLSYILVSTFLTSLNMGGQASVGLRRYIRSGDISLQLIKPVGLILRLLSEDLGEVGLNLVTNVLPVYVMAFAWFHPRMPASGLAWVVTVAAVIVGYFMRCLITVTFSLLGFWLLEVEYIEDAFNRILLDVLSGAFMPLWLMPVWLQRVAGWFPFRAIYYLPGAVFVGRESVPTGLLQLAQASAWLLVVAAASTFVWHKMVSKLTVQGG